jgi:hypothetical protein
MGSVLFVLNAPLVARDGAQSALRLSYWLNDADQVLVFSTKQKHHHVFKSQ